MDRAWSKAASQPKRARHWIISRRCWRRAGCTFADVIRVNVSLTDIKRFAEMDAIYRDYASPPYPTRNTIGVNELWGGAQIGIDVWAIKPGE